MRAHTGVIPDAVRHEMLHCWSGTLFKLRKELTKILCSRIVPFMMERLYYVYILASRKDGVLYVGVTNDLARRLYEHREGKASAFTRKYHVKRLVWCEGFADVADAIASEKRIKKWRRGWKINLINEHNPDWRDLYTELA